jgi:C1A family cysteine protease
MPTKRTSKSVKADFSRTPHATDTSRGDAGSPAPNDTARGPRGSRVPANTATFPSRRGQSGGGTGTVFFSGQSGGCICPFFSSGQNGGGTGPGFRAGGQNGGGIGPVFLQPPPIFGRGLGYLPDVPDCRDKEISYGTSQTERVEIEVFLEKLVSIEKYERGFRANPLRLAIAIRDARTGKDIDRAIAAAQEELQARVNLGDTGNLTAVEDQGPIGSCTAQSVIGLVEYLIKAGTGETTDLSRMFLYKATRNLMGVRGDTGAYIRKTIQALAAFGAPLEKDWSYTVDLLDEEPAAFHYAYASNFKAVRYKRIDAYEQSPDVTCILARLVLAAGFPIALGFPVYESISEVTDQQHVIPLPTHSQDPDRGPNYRNFKDRVLGGHAVLAVGYDPFIRVSGASNDQPGAFIIKNSWGEQWGDSGFAYLPYDYVSKGLAVDLWTIFNNNWLNEAQFAE